MDLASAERLAGSTRAGSCLPARITLATLSFSAAWGGVPGAGGVGSDADGVAGAGGVGSNSTGVASKGGISIVSAG